MLAAVLMKRGKDGKDRILRKEDVETAGESKLEALTAWVEALDNLRSPAE